MNLKKLAIAAFASLPLAAFAFEDDDLFALYDEEDLISIATGTKTQIRFAPSVATVITSEQIRTRGATTIDEVLEMVPGIHVSLSTNNTLNSIFSIRGIHTSQNAQVLYLVDGVPFRQAFNGSRPARYSINVENIARVEVIRGPGSAVYGADAFSGVINIVSKTAEDLDGLNVGIRAGSFDRQDYWAQYGTQINDEYSFVSSFEYTTTEGDDDRVISVDRQSALDNDALLGALNDASNAPGKLETGFEVLNIRFGLESENFNTSLAAWLQRGVEWGDGILQAIDTQGSGEAEYVQWNTNFLGEFNESWKYEFKAGLSYYDTRREYYLLPAGTTVPVDADGNLTTDALSTAGLVTFVDGVKGNPEGREQKHFAEFINYYDGFTDHLIRFSAGYEYQELDTSEAKNFGPGVISAADFPAPPPPPALITVTGNLTDVSDSQFVYLPDSNRNIWYVTLQDEWAFANDWTLTAGVRHDHYSDFGSTTNPRLALVWATHYNLTSKLLYGRAFRSPSFVEQLSDNNPRLLGNPEVDPETIDTLELAFDYRPNENMNIKFNVFQYSVDDLIEFVPAPDLGTGVNQAMNTEGQDGYGFEFEIEWEPAEDLFIIANYAWQKSELDVDDTDVVDAPGSQFYLATTWQATDNISATIDLNHVRDRERNIMDARDSVDDYTIVHLNLMKKDVLEGFDVALIVRNIFDEDAREPSAYEAPAAPVPDDYLLEGRAFLAELRYHFSDSR